MAECQLCELDEPVMTTICRFLDARDLAKLNVQCQDLRATTSQSSLWQPLCEARWGDAWGPGRAMNADHHDGNWKRMYGLRARMCSALVTAIDRCHVTTLKQQGGCSGTSGRYHSDCFAGGEAAASPAGSPVKSNVYGFQPRPFIRVGAMAVEDVMRHVFTVGLCMSDMADRLGSSASSSSGRSAAAAHPEFRLHRSDIEWWLQNKPEPMIKFARSIADDLAGHWDMWTGGSARWPEVPWRRSALAFLMEIARSLGVCPSIIMQLSSAATRADRAIRQLDEQSVEGELRIGVRPAGVPVGHWWWDVTGKLRG